MDSTKKRKLDENGVVLDKDPSSALKLSPEDARRLIERFTPDQLLDILQDALSRHVDILDVVRSIANPDVSHYKLFIHCLGWDITTEGLRSLFSGYGELDEVIVILDKTTRKSKGYGFVMFRHVDSALMALKEPSKKIDDCMTITQLPSAGNSNSNNVADVSLRKIYVANVPYDMSSDKLLAHFALYEEIEDEWIRNDSRANEINRRNDRPRNFERRREITGPSVMPRDLYLPTWVIHPPIWVQARCLPTTTIKRLPKTTIRCLLITRDGCHQTTWVRHLMQDGMVLDNSIITTRQTWTVSQSWSKPLLSLRLAIWYDEFCRHDVDKQGGCSRWAVGWRIVVVLNDILFGILLWSEPGCLSFEYYYIFEVISYAISRVFTFGTRYEL